MFNTKNKGFGFGKMPGFNRAKKGTISNGDFDRDGVKNRGDCQAFNFKKQGSGHKEYLEGESIDEYRRRVHPGMEKPWTEEERLAHKKSKKGIKEAVDAAKAKRGGSW